MTPAYPFAPKDGPRDPSGRPCFLPLLDVHRTNFDPSCPHCRRYVEGDRYREGENVCPKCTKTYFLHMLPGHYYLTSKVRMIHAFLWN